MNLLLPLASILGIEVGDLVERVRKNAVLWSVIALFGLIGLGFLLLGAYLGLGVWVGPIWSALILGTLSLMVAAIVYAAAGAAEHSARQREVERRRSAETTALVTTAAVTALPMLLKSPLMRSVGIPVGAALAALYLASRLDGKSDDSAN